MRLVGSGERGGGAERIQKIFGSLTQAKRQKGSTCSRKLNKLWPKKISAYFKLVFESFRTSQRVHEHYGAMNNVSVVLVLF